MKMKVVFSHRFCLTAMKNDSAPAGGRTGKFITCLISQLTAALCFFSMLMELRKKKVVL